MAQPNVKISYSSDELRRAREMDLLTYMRMCEPHNLVPNGSTEYRLRDNHSVAITVKNGAWYDHADGEGGYAALSFLIEKRGYTLQNAAAELLGLMGGTAPNASLRVVPPPKELLPREFVLPEAYENNRRVFAYLRSRGIAPEVINHHIKRGALYEEAEYHNAVFVGFDGNIPRYAALRGTLSESKFAGEVAGSRKEFGFGERFPGRDSNTLYVFESAIDLMSVQTIRLKLGRDWRSGSYLSLGGVTRTKKDRGEPAEADGAELVEVPVDENAKPEVIPAALVSSLEKHHEPPRVMLCLDSDKTGIAAAQRFERLLVPLGIEVTIKAPQDGSKDWNESLCRRFQETKQRGMWR